MKIQKSNIFVIDSNKDKYNIVRMVKYVEKLWKSYVSVKNIDDYNIMCSMKLLNGSLDILIIDDDALDVGLIKNIRKELVNSILLISINSRNYDKEVINEFGVAGVNPYKRSGSPTELSIIDDPVTFGLPKRLKLRCLEGEKVGILVPAGATVLLSDQQGNPFMTRFKNRYALSIPIWQLGVPSFPAIFNILRNLLYFSNDIGHFSPTPYVSLRIDDFPLSSEQYLKSGGVSDESRCSEVETLCDWSKIYGAKLEFMVSSHILRPEGNLFPIDANVPKSAAKLRDYFCQGVINLNSHGRSHVDEEQYISTRQVSPLEFANLDEEKTKEHLRANIDFMKGYFGKTPKGFVPPCWSYREFLTKKVCSEYFSFVIDSNEHARNREDCPPFGHLDNNGLLHLAETWHLGGIGPAWQDTTTWRPFLECGIPLHMMAHGLYLHDPVPSRSIPKALTLAAFALLLPYLVFGYWSEILQMVRRAGGGITWDRLGLLRKMLVRLPWFADASVETLLKKGNEIGVEWVFTEELADHLRWYSGLEVLEYRRNSNLHRITFNLKCEAHGRFLFHLPQPSLEAELDGQPLSSGIGGRTLTLANMAAGHHLLIVKV